MDILRTLMQRTRGIRRCGSAALDMVYVACGRFDAFFEWGLNPWDVAAGKIIVEQAGGTVCGIINNINPVWDSEILAINPEIHQEWKSLIDQIKTSD